MTPVDVETVGFRYSNVVQCLSKLEVDLGRIVCVCVTAYESASGNSNRAPGAVVGGSGIALCFGKAIQNEDVVCG